MTPLEQKLDQLNLKAMSRQIEATVADAAEGSVGVKAGLAAVCAEKGSVAKSAAVILLR